MTEEQFTKFRHEAVHVLMRLNESCESEFHISSWPHWDYDLERGTLTLSQDGVPKVVASIQLVGTTSKTAGTWLWGWGNENLPTNVTEAVAAVRAVGETESLSQLTNASMPDDEYVGWEMTAIAARVLGSKGAYRCPGSDGFIYLVYAALRLATDEPSVESNGERVECSTHGSGFLTYVCNHQLSNPALEWFSRDPDDAHKWPDAWCSACDKFFLEEGEWNEKNSQKLEISLVGHRCYERLRAEAEEATSHSTPS